MTQKLDKEFYRKILRSEELLLGLFCLIGAPAGFVLALNIDPTGWIKWALLCGFATIFGGYFCWKSLRRPR